MGKKTQWQKRNARRAEKTNAGVEGAQKNLQGVRGDYKDIVKDNEAFQTYYKLQKIVPEADWDKFMQSLRESLPTAFRITGCRSQAKALLHIIEKRLIRDVIEGGKGEGELKDQFQAFPLPWYPDKFGWQMNLTRKDIRSNEAYFRLHNFLISETDSGNISRQEAVSMIPPLALKVEPHHKVLDMCAAPGSKTAQLIESLHGGTGDGDMKNPEGVLVANDMDNKRCYMLVHQSKRIQSPALIITNHDAARFPDLLYTDKDGKLEGLKFDRILCDVPCTGDGTTRKNVDVWKKWNAWNGVSIHQVQYGILKRGLELLEIGGHVVYSTCSLNPIENEAIIHRVLRDSEGAVELLDIDLPNLIHSPGLSFWKACNKEMETYETFNDVPEKFKSMFRPYHFPPTAEEASNFHLEKCMRVLPHQQDTGGFFISLLKKVRSLPWEKPVKIDERPELSVFDPEVEPHKGGPSPKKARLIQGFKEDPYVFMSADDPIWLPLREFYELDPLLSSTQFLTRSFVGKKKNIYFTTELVRDIVKSNEGYVKIINTGVKTFARADNKWTPCDFRLAHEGLACLLPYIKGRRVTVPKEDLLILLLNNEEDTPPKIDTLSNETQLAVTGLERGSFVLVMNSCKEEDGTPPFTIEMIGWKGNASLRAYVGHHERLHYLRMCGGDVSKFETNKFKLIEDKNVDGEQEETHALLPNDESENGNSETNGSVTVSTTEVVV